MVSLTRKLFRTQSRESRRFEAVQRAVHVLEDFYDVVSLCLSSSSDELRCFLKLIGHRLAGWNMRNISVMSRVLGRLVSAVVFLFALVSWWKHRGTAILGTDCADHRNRAVSRFSNIL